MKILSTLVILCLSCLVVFGQTNESKTAFNDGLKHYRLKEYQEAIPYLETAVEKSPDFVEAYRLMAHCYDASDNIDKAIENYNLALAINPNLDKSLYNLGLLYISKKEYDKAEDYLQKAVKISPNYVAAKTKLKKLQEMNGEEIENSEDVIDMEAEDFTPPSYESESIEVTTSKKTTTKIEVEEIIEVKGETKKSKKELRKERKALKKKQKAERKKRKAKL